MARWRFDESLKPFFLIYLFVFFLRFWVFIAKHWAGPQTCQPVLLQQSSTIFYQAAKYFLNIWRRTRRRPRTWKQSDIFNSMATASYMSRPGKSEELQTQMTHLDIFCSFCTHGHFSNFLNVTFCSFAISDSKNVF